MFTNPDAFIVPIYTVDVTYVDGRRERFRNVAEIRNLRDYLELEILSHGIQKIKLTAVNSHNASLQSTLILEDDD
jgi:hypothetical protein